ncbi:uncharacterized protein FFB14_14821 [Fusarium fujikuroi]|nr:uncharacterized protein FFB14_14821 [Fusarium fujikuroi]
MWERRLRHDSAQLATSSVQSLDRSLLVYPRIAIPNPRRGKYPERDQYDISGADGRNGMRNRTVAFVADEINELWLHCRGMI